MSSTITTTQQDSSKPTFTDPYQERKHLLEHTAAAFRFFERHGYNEGVSGHISVRDPVDPSTFWINPLGKHFAMMKASDMVQVDEDGNVIGGNKHVVNAAGFKIHSVIHKARPDVNAACHAHSIYGKAYSCFGKPLQMLSQDSCLFYNAHGVYKDFGGVVLEQKESNQIAQALGNGKAVILQNHGNLTTGSTVDEAAILFFIMERTSQAQLLADSCTNNTKRPISDKAAKFTFDALADSDSLYSEFQPEYDYEVYRNDDFLFKDNFPFGPDSQN
ncbi:putative aldolase [Ascoidea rubescens DSM 1968]|uniref:Putative aldolase n=1 Tax=Ascoidea rubescens DSM 1968 TaxID=1344418 RepID=A0A1D2V9C2_9ASCO|nr:putative aldolase [Ascoidea rubescens DSM 1968]ODV58238.1 putative aldolase [Ascoidea rubescens DSM 1968]